MRLSQMIANNKPEESEIENEELTLDPIVDDNETAETNTSEETQQIEEDPNRGTAADVTEDELEFIKSIANPEATPASVQETEVDADTQAELDALKNIAGI